MFMGPAFRRFGSVVLFVALAVSGCSEPAEEDASSPQPPPSTSTTVANSSPSTFPSIAPTPPSSLPETADREQLAAISGQLLVLNSSRELVLVQPDGTGRTLISSPGVPTRQPTWSPDGDSVVWTALTPSGAQISTATLSTGDIVTADAPNAPFFYAWSPDASWIAALGPHPQGVELLVTQRSATTTRSIGTGQPFYIDWLVDDALVAVINTTALVEINVDPSAAAPAELGVSAPLGVFRTPARLTDEAVVVGLESTSGNSIVARTADGAETVLAKAPGPVAFSPHPAGSELAVLVFDADDEFQVISAQVDAPPVLRASRVSVIDLNDPGAARTLDVDNPIAMSWSPDGNTLAVLRSTNRQLEWVFVRDDEVLPGTPFLPSPEFATAYLPFADQYDRVSTWWSPDSSAFVFAGSVDQSAGIWVDLVDDDNGARLVADGQIAFWSPVD